MKTICQCGCGEELKPSTGLDRIVRYKQHHFFRNHKFPESKLRGSKHPFWKGGRLIDKQGYVRIHKPDHPRVWKYNNYIFEHVLVVEKHMDLCMLPWGIVHHINGNKQDNRIENLKPMMRRLHQRYHARTMIRKRKEITNKICFYWRQRWNWLFYGRSLGKNQFSSI